MQLKNINVINVFLFSALANLISFPQIHVLETPFLNIDCGHLRTFDADLYRQLVCYPQEVIPTFDMSVNEVFFEKYPDAQLQHQIQVQYVRYGNNFLRPV